MRDFTAKELNKLTKQELIHFLMSFDCDIEKIVKTNIAHQTQEGIKCFECQSIAQKLSIKI